MTMLRVQEIIPCCLTYPRRKLLQPEFAMPPGSLPCLPKFGELNDILLQIWIMGRRQRHTSAQQQSGKWPMPAVSSIMLVMSIHLQRLECPISMHEPA